MSVSFTPPTLINETPEVIEGQPTLPKLQKLQRQLYENTRAVDSYQGGGMWGHIGMIMSPTAYAIKSPIPYTAPPAPPRYPAPGATPDVTETNRIAHKDQLYQVKLHQYMYVEAKKFIVKAVEPVYLRALQHPVEGLDDKSPWELLDHLFTNYGVPTDLDIQQNRDTMTADFNPDEPIEAYFNRIEECMRFAADNNVPISDREATAIMYQGMVKSGVFGHETANWNSRTQANKSYDNFVDVFTRANKARCENLTTTGAVYHGAHAVTPTKPPRPDTATGSGTTTPTATAGNAGGTLCWYCFSHGTGYSPKHTSALCRDKPGYNNVPHNAKATIKNKMGGNPGWQSESRRLSLNGQTPQKEE
jgi:hypothetical protein